MNRHHIPTVSSLSQDVLETFMSSVDKNSQVDKKKGARKGAYGYEVPLDVEGSPFATNELVSKISYVAYDDVLCRLPGKNYARLERYSPLDETWIPYAPYHIEVGLKGKRISEEDAAKMAKRLYEEKEKSFFSEEQMPPPLVPAVMGMPVPGGTQMPPPTIPTPTVYDAPPGVDPADWSKFMREQAKKQKKRKGAGHVCTLPGFSAAEGMVCQACSAEESSSKR
jgi:hypothetical protein